MHPSLLRLRTPFIFAVACGVVATGLLLRPSAAAGESHARSLSQVRKIYVEALG